MQKLKIIFLTLLTCSSFFISTAKAEEFVIVTAPPLPRNVVEEPRGYQRCYVIPSGWYNGVWVNRHRICQYRHVRRPQVWVASYWKCDRFNRWNGTCMHWHWVPSHWADSRVPY